MALGKAAVHRHGHFIKRLGFAFLAVLIFFALAEVLLRVFDVNVQSGSGGGNRGAFYFSMKQGANDMDTHLVLGVRVKPLDPVDYRINGPVSPKPEGAFRLLCLGDSSTYGIGVKKNETYCAQLESMLEEKLAPRPVDAVNAGFPGFSSYQGRMLFEQYQKVLSPDAVVFYFGANDMVFAPLRQDKDWGVVPLWALKTNRVLYQSSRLYQVLRNVNLGYILQSLVHPFNESARQTPYRMRVSFEDFSANLSAIEKLAAKSGAEVYVIPYLGMDGDKLVHTAYYNKFKPPGMIGLTPAFDAALKNGKKLFVDGVHPNPEGHRIIAELLSDEILSDLSANDE